MAFLSKKPTPAEPFRVPSLANADPAYAALATKQAELHAEQAALRTERRELERTIAAEPRKEYSSRVAELLGEQVDDVTMPRKRLAEVLGRERDVAAALEIVRQRLQVARSTASQAVCALARPEYARRVAAMVEAMLALDVAHKAYVDLVDDFVTEDISWTALVPMTPTFLGNPRDTERQIARFVRDAKAAGYHHA